MVMELSFCLSLPAVGSELVLTGKVKDLMPLLSRITTLSFVGHFLPTWGLKSQRLVYLIFNPLCQTRASREGTFNKLQKALSFRVPEVERFCILSCLYEAFWGIL